ncbi:hypothetical protein QBC41DRAFT_328563 [Cercophora samala]|uniref:Uncharacterized protein n=1 Tax=Cercophora samala TaxID=330535 RepID=A0AA40D6E5_9PEZI|nr:hypothetical protein QBC41DRAFT_328563 [Cercophora samala]
MNSDKPPRKFASADTAAIKRDILHGLNSIRSSGAFATVVCLDSDVDPQLEPNSGVVDILIPRYNASIWRGENRYRQIRQLLTKIKTSVWDDPDTAPLVDGPIWRLHPADFAHNPATLPAWDRFMQNQLCPYVGKQLGITEPSHTVRAEISCLVFQEEGPVPDPHSVFPKLPASFGTLVIHLDSLAEGGEIVLRHDDQEIIYTPGGITRGAMSVVAWHNEVDYTVLPVTTFFRTMLVYSLFLGERAGEACEVPASTLSSALKAPLDTGLLRDAIGTWLQRQDTGQSGLDCIYHVLNRVDNGTRSPLSTLVGQNFRQAQALVQLSKELPFEVMFATLEKTDKGRCKGDCNKKYDRRKKALVPADLPPHLPETDFHEMVEVDNSQTIVSELRSLDGSVLMKGPVVLGVQDMETFLQSDPFDFENVKKKEEEYGMFKGNWGPLATHRYTAHALLLVPRPSLFQFFSELRPTSPCKPIAYQDLPLSIMDILFVVPDEGVYLSYVARSIAVDGVDSTLFRDALVKKLELLMMPADPDDQAMTHLSRGDFPLQHCLMATICLGRFDLLRKLAAHNASDSEMPLAETAIWSREYLLASPTDAPKRFEQIREGLDILINCYVDEIFYRIQFLKFLVPRAQPAPEIPELDRWVHDTLRKCLEDIAERGDQVGEHESHALLELARYLPGATVVDYFSHTVLSILPPAKFPPAIYLSFLGSLSAEVQGEDLYVDSLVVADELYRLVVSRLLECIDFTRLMPHDLEDEEWETKIRYEEKAGKGVNTVNGWDLEKISNALVRFHIMDGMGFKRDGHGTLSRLSPPPFDQKVTSSPPSLWTVFTNRILEQAWDLPAMTEHLKHVWLPLINELVAGEGLQGIVQDLALGGHTTPAELLQTVQQKYTLLGGTLAKSLLSRTIGLGCGTMDRHFMVHDMLSDHGPDDYALKQMLGERLYRDIGNGTLGPFLEELVLSGRVLRGYRAKLMVWPGRFVPGRKGKTGMWDQTWDLTLYRRRLR